MFNQKISYSLESAKREISPLLQMIPRQMQTILQSRASQLKQLENAFSLQDPKLKNKKGFAQISKEGRVIELAELEIGDSFEVMTDKVSVQAHVDNIKQF